MRFFAFVFVFSILLLPCIYAFTTPKLNLLLIDHYDSFTYNLVHALHEFAHVKVVAADTTEALDLSQIDGLILSPGPGHPRDYPLGRQLIQNYPQLPILGVCLGHQMLGDCYGATVERAPEPVHGQVHTITTTTLSDEKGRSPLWKNVEFEQPVTRYHSLCVTKLPSDSLQVIASYENIVMGLQHKVYPHYGVQFHPESIGTPFGTKLLENFCEICREHQKKEKTTSEIVTNGKTHENIVALPQQRTVTTFIHALTVKSKAHPSDLIEAFQGIYKFWIDAGPKIHLLGECTKRIEYNQETQTILEYDNNNHCTPIQNDILSYLDEKYRTVISKTIVVDSEGKAIQQDLPFDFRGGHVGYLGYEVRHDTTRFLEDQEHGQHQHKRRTSSTSDSFVPTAAFLWADRSFVYDEKSDSWYLVALAEDEDTSDAFEWIQQQSQRLLKWSGEKQLYNPQFDEGREPGNRLDTQPLEFVPNRSRATYARNFDDCIEHIRRGDSYELCLTNQLEAKRPTDKRPLDLYKLLRQKNPAPHSGYFHWNVDEKDSSSESAVAICSSSPERFVSVKRMSNGMMQVEAKPIKGTIARILPSDGRELSLEESRQDLERAQTLQSSVKDRAENLMIVDLLRNDLSRVCDPGSVHVAKLMDIESFRSVHQMVSTIRGTLGDRSMIDVLRVSFPGGSMTGAPKLRTMELLDDLEEGVSRGPYSGCLGYMSVNGCMDMNIIIRTAVVTPEKISVGAGGAITILSKDNDEYEEMLLKASAVVNTVKEWAESPVLHAKKPVAS